MDKNNEGFLGKAGKAIKGAFAKNDDPQIKNYTMPTLPLPSNREVNEWLKLELSHLIRDILAPIKIDDSLFGGSAVYPYEKRSITQKGQNINDIILNYFLDDTAYYSKIVINQSIAFVVNMQPNENNQIELSLKNGQTQLFDVNKAICVQGMGNQSMLHSLKVLFMLLNQVYHSLNNAAAFGAKTVISVEGLTNLMNTASANSDMQILDEIKQEIEKQAISITTQKIALLDSKTTLNSFAIDIEPASKMIEIIYNELARILKIPRTKLLGTAPQGMNATGKYDDKSYNDLLNSIRHHLVYRVLDLFEFSYQTENLVDVDYLTKSLQAIMLADSNPSLTDDQVSAIKTALFKGQIDGF